jgi:hypothetical protein
MRTDEWEQHYPGGGLADVGADYDLLRAEAAKMVSLMPVLCLRAC